MRIVSFDIGMGRSEGEVVKDNDKTVIVRTNRASKTIQIKRHKEKHRVEVVEEA
jgi:hypothetical protein